MIRQTEERDGWEIVTPGGEVVDTITLLGLERPFHEEVLERTRAAQRTYRVRRFSEILNKEV
jgi:hypothetical protein